ncbi:hypothetical protein PEPS_09080 [Persicobacter psychrovividus]|uniref:Uncharacterized protein n=1 Tax=Persicobacter psychrovividus TaxID=387638 RepID=A0ABM7VCG3_9BACT|nr:hypothetical protein PEPS_09080 [Persicobacter psychrovividus]
MLFRRCLSLIFGKAYEDYFVTRRSHATGVFLVKVFFSVYPIARVSLVIIAYYD